MRTRFLPMLGMLIFLMLPDAFSQERFKFDVAVEAAHSAAAKKRDSLFDNYAKAVERVQAGFQQGGDLANALKAREEATRAREQRVLGSNEIPKIGKLRTVMLTELDKVRLAEAKSIAKLRGVFIERLTAEVSTLTKDGKLDEAVAANKLAGEEKKLLAEGEALIAELRLKGKPAPLVPSPASPTPGGEQHEAGLVAAV